MIPQTAATVEKLRAARDYEGALLEIAKLRPAIDKFFDKVMVMVDDEQSPRQSPGSVADRSQGILHDRRFFRDRDRRQGIYEIIE